MQVFDFKFENDQFDLAATGGVAMGYGPGICMHKLISKTELPDDNLIKSYFNDLINCYDNLLENDVSSNLRKVFSEKNYWIIAAGEQAVYWDEFRSQNFISIGWQIGDLSKLKQNKK